MAETVKDIFAGRTVGQLMVEAFEDLVDDLKSGGIVNYKTYEIDAKRLLLEATLDSKENMEKVYVVASEKYSEYEIDGIFSTKELADEYLVLYNKSSFGKPDAKITEWQLDKKHHLRQFWESKINMTTGVIEHVKGVTDSEWFEFASPELRVREGWFKQPTGKSPNLNLFAQFFSYVSQDHADSLAIEARQELMRNYDLNKFKLCRPYTDWYVYESEN